MKKRKLLIKTYRAPILGQRSTTGAVSSSYDSPTSRVVATCIFFAKKVSLDGKSLKVNNQAWFATNLHYYICTKSRKNHGSWSIGSGMKKD